MADRDRYQRQMILPAFGLTAQEKLLAAKVLIVGMGGLGCPVLQYLVGAGVGYIGIMDADTISLSNLHRQLLFTESDIGLSKVDQAAAKMQLLNSDVTIEKYPFHLEQNNALSIISKYDLVIDATDNFPAKYLLNDACVLLKKPFVFGAVSRYEGQVSVFNTSVAGERAINYRDLFPDAPKHGEVPSCAEAGVIGVLPGIIGAMQASEAIKCITGIGNPLVGRLYHYNLLQAQGFEIAISANETNIPLSEKMFLENNYHAEDDEMDITEISVSTFHQMRVLPEVFVLDVRERNEYPPIDFSDAQIPMSELQAKMHELPEKEICIICHQGIRSIYAAQQISKKRNLKVYSLKGGLIAYFK
jgi:sulfur-carrier protein adenylyltransferase/sulfurtransferase